MSYIPLAEAIRIAADGDAIAFVGAGIGQFISTPNGKMPRGYQLSNLLLGRPSETSNAPALDKAAGFALRSGMGADKVYNILKENLTVSSVDPGLETVFRLPWRRIYTTNYDDSIEKSRSGFLPTKSLTLEDAPEKMEVGSIIHLNGSLKRLSPASIENNISLTDSSYTDRIFEKSPWQPIFKRDLELSRSIIFIGYSLYDLDITRILAKSEISGRTIFFVSPDIDEVELDSFADYGDARTGGIEELIASVPKFLEDYEPSINKMRYINLREISSADVPPVENAARAMEDQLFYGVLPETEVISDQRAIDDIEFVIPRAQQIETQKKILKGLTRDVTVVGELLSGKTATALSLTGWLIRQGYRAFLAENGPKLADELAHLATVDDKVVVVFDGYSPFRPVIREYARRRHVKHRLILTEQAVHHEFINDFIYEPALAGQMDELLLDRITTEDAPKFASLVNFAGFWGQRAGSSDASNAAYIGNRLDGSLFKLLTEIIESPEAQKRISSLIESISYNRKATEIFVAACIVNVLGFNFRPSDWSAAFDIQSVRSVLKNYEGSLKYFFSVQSQNVFTRSGLLSSAILERIEDREIVQSATVKIFDACSKMKEPYNIYDDIYVRLMQFNKIQPIMRGKSEKQLILGFYDLIRAKGETHNISDYWLQLGIAATAFDDLNTAEKAFDNAYTREKKKKKPNTRKIDNYLYRYELKRSEFVDDSQEAISLFDLASKGLSIQIFLEDNRHYPFKSGRVYGSIATKHFKNWSAEEQKKFVEESRGLKASAERYRKEKDPHSIDANVLIRELSDLLKKVGGSESMPKP